MSLNDGRLYRTLWRWHFYAGLMVMPLILLLSLTGALYLFKPQVERWEERAYQGLPLVGAVSPNAQAEAAIAAFPGSRFQSYRLPEQRGDAAMIHLALADGAAMRDVFVSPQGRVLGSMDPERRVIAIDHDIHGQLLLGRAGSWIVELAASWAIVMILTGLYLWWPRGRRLAGVVWPRLGHGKRAMWRDLHAVTGFWVAGFALVLLVTGLPWTDAWGSAFKAVRGEMGWVKGKQDWTIGGRPPSGGEHAEHDHRAM
ncbi:MAG TPA: PepSY domain-containing protein, partial [Candidatus Polarisedimenticolia bacterium]|nr:PepSY domain-containing protein [Candidatus Polarisedimenticolia bacterium]